MTPAQSKKETLFPSLLSDLFDTDRFFSNRWFEREFKDSVPAVNVIENGKEFNIDFAAPGFSKADFVIDVEDNVLTVSAERSKEEKKEDENFTRKEFSYNSFSRSFNLPKTLNTEKIDARYSEGILRLSIPKKEETKTPAKKQFRVA